MKTLTTILLAIAITTLFGQSQKDIEQVNKYIIHKSQKYKSSQLDFLKSSMETKQALDSVVFDSYVDNVI